jgi:hypothetical protein
MTATKVDPLVEFEPLDELSEPPLNQPKMTMPPEVSINWQTPGSFLASRIEGIAEVRYVFEWPTSEGWHVLVIVSEDPGHVLDRIFEAEGDLFKAFQRNPIDVRVMRRGPDWSPDDLGPNRCLLRRP